MKYWFFLVVAAMFETAWTFCLKFLQVKNIRMLRFNNFYKPQELSFLLPLVGYILFGLGNVYFFSLAMKKIPAATALAVWMAFSLIFVKIAEVMWFHQKVSLNEVFFMVLILTGIIGMKIYAPLVSP